MQVTTDRISSLCTSIGHAGDDGYVPSDDCQINLDELAYAIWHDDESVKNVSIQAFELGVFKRDLIPVMQLGDPLAYVALKALTAITYPPGSNIEDYDRHITILRSYKLEVSMHPELIPKVMEYLAPVLENPIADDETLNRAEMAISFIRNIVVVPSEPDVHERLFNILDDSLLFDAITELNLSRLGPRKVNLARLLCGIFFGCFAAFLPFKLPRREAKMAQPQASPLLAAFLAEQKRPISGSRHGHWGATVTVKRRTGGQTIPAPLNVSERAPMPQGKPMRGGRRRPIDADAPVPTFSERADGAASKIMESRVFPLVFELAFPKSFNAYDVLFGVRDQLQLADLVRFFMEFAMLKGMYARPAPLCTSAVTGYFESAALFWLESKGMVIGGISGLGALHTLCKTFASVTKFMAFVISKGMSGGDVQTMSEIVSRSAGGIEDALVAFLAQKNLSKKSMAVLRDNIVAIDCVYQLYAVAEENELVRVKLLSRDGDATGDDGDIASEERLDKFSADMVTDRLAKRQDVLTPFFVLLDHVEQVDDETMSAMARILERFTKRKRALAHLFRLPFLHVINKLCQDKSFSKRNDKPHDALEEVMNVIIKKFFESVRVERTALVQIIAGVDVDDVYDDGESYRRANDDYVVQPLDERPEREDSLSDSSGDIDATPRFTAPKRNVDGKSTPRPSPRRIPRDESDSLEDETTPQRVTSNAPARDESDSLEDESDETTPQLVTSNAPARDESDSLEDESDETTPQRVTSNAPGRDGLENASAPLLANKDDSDSDGLEIEDDFDE